MFFVISINWFCSLCCTIVECCIVGMPSILPVWSRLSWLLLGDCLVSICLSRAMESLTSSRHIRFWTATNLKPVWVQGKDMMKKGHWAEKDILFEQLKSKVIPLLNHIQHSEDTWGSGGRALCVLNLTTVCR